MLPTLDQLLSTFEAYNLDIWPMQIVAYVLGIAALFFAIRRTRISDRVVTGILAFLWLWNAVGFFILYFARVYVPAYAFGALFLVQGLLFLADLIRPRLSYHPQGTTFTVAGLLLIAYAMVGYPLFSLALGYRYPQAPPFGLTPCPLTVFTFGLFLFAERPFPKRHLAVPIWWALSGVIPVSVGILQDTGLILSGIVATAMLLNRERRSR
jgi:hypothetical protein